MCVVLNMSHFLPHMLLWITPSSREYGLSPPPLSSLFLALPPCVLMRGPGKCLEGGRERWKKEGLLDWCPRVWVWVPLPLGRKWWENSPHFIHTFMNPFVFVSLTCYGDCLLANTLVDSRIYYCYLGDCWNNNQPFVLHVLFTTLIILLKA